MLIPAIAEVLAGVIVVWLAIRIWRGRAARNWAVGGRTRSTIRSDAAFAVANQAAARLTIAGGAVLAVGGVLATALPQAPGGRLRLRQRGNLSPPVPPRCRDRRASLAIRLERRPDSGLGFFA